MKKLLFILASVVLSALMLFAGCSLSGSDGIDGRDGKDGQNVTIEDIYNKYVSEHGDISFEDFLKEYLNYTNGELENATSLRTAINRSLMSGVTILTKFNSTQTSYKVYTGSGAILWMDKSAGDAFVVTNAHVIYDNSTYCPDIRLYLYGQDTAGVNYLLSGVNDITGDENYRIPAEIVGASLNYDIALLKVTGSTVLKRSDAVAVSNKKDVAEALSDCFSKEESPIVGETVYTVGNASVEGMSASSGIIAKDSENIDISLSQSGSSSKYTYRVMRITAPINHGNSGGALYNREGKIVGIVNAKEEGNEVDCMGYALPANSVRRIIRLMYDSYVSNGNKPVLSGSSKYGIDKAFLNITTVVSDSYARLGEDGLAVITELVKIQSVGDGPAQGVLQAGDIFVSAKLTSADGKVKEDIKITRSFGLSDMLFSARAGDTLTLVIERDKTEKQVSVNFKSTNFKYYA